jgi:2-polyprenyl-3-methyl-5-hydroxy-6-metoxy-1,4-benzoquinol methylase
MSEFKYVGTELDLFAAVHNWKSYWSDRIRPFVNGDVLEVGAGMGSNTSFLDPGGTGRWVCLEPDSRLIAQLTENLAHSKSRSEYETLCGTLRSLDASQKFDTIIYIDVLEHIENDRYELEIGASRLRAGGPICSLPSMPRLDISGGTTARCCAAFLRPASASIT